MSKKIFSPGTMLSPVPAVLVSCGKEDAANIITVAWTGICCTKPPMTYISIRPERYSYNIIKESGEFVINLPVKGLVKALDTCGVKSGKDFDKFKNLGLHKELIEGYNTPAISESPLSIVCKVDRIIPLGSHDMFLAKIETLAVDEKIISESGKICLEKCDLLAYSHGAYYTLGEKLGTFGFSVRKKK